MKSDFLMILLIFDLLMCTLIISGSLEKIERVLQAQSEIVLGPVETQVSTDTVLHIPGRDSFKEVHWDGYVMSFYSDDGELIVVAPEATSDL